LANVRFKDIILVSGAKLEKVISNKSQNRSKLANVRFEGIILVNGIQMGRICRINKNKDDKVEEVKAWIKNF
jgi:hypothetical protein